MERSPQIWFTRLDEPTEEAAAAPDTSQPECSICYDAYDHVFKTPKVLDCAHSFCLECLSHLANGKAADDLSCPLCRRRTALPPGGPPALTTDREILRQLPGPQRREEPVWLEGEELCCKSVDSAGAPEEFCICVDIGAARTPRAGGAPRRRREGALYPSLKYWIMASVAVAWSLGLLCFLVLRRPQDFVEHRPTTTPASHEALWPRGLPTTRSASHDIRLLRGPPTTRPARHEARPPRGPPTTRPAHHEIRLPRYPAATRPARHEARPPRGPPATRPSGHEALWPRGPLATRPARHEARPPRGPLATRPSGHEARPPRGPPATRPAHHEALWPRGPLATRPARHEARPPRGPPATRPAHHEARQPRGPPATRPARHEARPPRGPPATRPAHHEARLTE